MTNVEKNDYGFKLIFAGSISQDEMASWVEISRNALTSQISKFGVIIDMRELSPLSPGAKSKLLEGQKLFKEKGMTRSAVIVSQGFIASQLKLVAKDTGIYEWEKYIDSSSKENWEELAINWITNGSDPDLN
jgi:hypothetical protein